MGLGSGNLKDAVKLSEGQLSASCPVPKKYLDQCFEREEAKERKFSSRKPSKNEPYLVKSLIFLVLPFALRLRPDHTKQAAGSTRPQMLYPLWIPLNLDREGRFTPSEDLPDPWFARELLQPAADSVITLGDLTDQDRYLGQNSLTPDASWDRRKNFAFALYKFVLDGSNTDLEALGYDLDLSAACAFQFDLMDGASRAVIQLYDFLIKGTKDKTTSVPSLLDKLGRASMAPERRFLDSLTVAQNSRLHLGQMKGNFGLQESQREAIAHLLLNHPEEPLVVNGPPGTGKTTLIQSFIATKWIEAALKEEDPPLIVASSANNQAVTNIIDSFSNKHQKPSALEQRWLPNLKSHGLYLVANTAAEAAENSGYFYKTQGNSKSSYAEFLNQNIQELEEAFVAAAKKETKEEFNRVSQWKNHLKAKLDHLRGVLETGLERNLAYLALKGTLEKEFGPAHTWAVIIQQIEAEIVAKKSQLSVLSNVPSALKSALRSLSWRTRLLAWFPFNSFAKEELYYCCEAFLVTLGFRISVEKPHPKAILQAARQALQDTRERLFDLQASLEKLQPKLAELAALKAQFLTWAKEQKAEVDPDLLLEFDNPQGLLPWLDKNVRYPMFWWATHYWECRWLLAANEQIKGFGVETAIKKLKRDAMLTPCMVTTLFKGPDFFNYPHETNDFRPLLEGIDLLVVDEAGQASPALAGGMLALAKQVLVVGDVKQIEPVIKVTEAVDFGNARRLGLCKDTVAYKKLKPLKILASSYFGGTNGNLMGLASRQVGWQKYQGDVRFLERGLVLLEHWRSVPEIVNYCNKLCYQGLLKPQRADSNNFPWPRMGLYPTLGEEKKRGGSRYNPAEAEALAAWIEAQEDFLLREYPGKSLDQLIGIVTPFAAQKEAIRTALYNRKLKIEKVGTVHTLQGAERPIVLFSPVYNPGSVRQYFFDHTPNMLNVAVSRAQDAFLVFGDPAVFTTADPDAPSSILGHYLVEAG
ncbi:MAG: hypothetical protein A2527_02440 [Candidatus Lambdaproteobacteria bacterium RIFOXYD2_FULL_50_16]|uniref:CHASE domain-containing protein n=1 Tax=Candidatus Lambdaproteobacteria bacterium RIFOXYD2_FULL_50_16 TaxID=1817772 RepID=A0A1F6GDZ1_9PROT|nr:MAG: hypothetical protein A2527_02440 [Candidatus Lambdaproteobacteria bacterium RIFOXYD2_FULL_50_16]